MENKELIRRMAFNGFALQDGYFHRHVYTGRRLYSDVIKFEDASNWLDNPTITEKIHDNDIQVFLTDYDRHVSASHVTGGLLFSSISGYRDERLSDEQIEKILSCIKKS